MNKDFEIQKNVMEQLAWEPLLNATEIGVAVKQGIVTLSGELDSYAKKLAAERATKKIPGVKAIAEDIKVGISPANKKTDTEIAESIMQSFQLNLSVPTESIRVNVEDGTVTLEGQVDWDYQRNAAWRCVEDLPSIKVVYNLIALRPKDIPLNIEKKISAAFHRNATLDAKGISVFVAGSKAILEGVVHTVIEKDTAENIAWSAPGILSVENRLEIYPYISD